MSAPSRVDRLAVSVMTWWETSPTVQQARTDHSELFKPENYQWAITLVETGMMVAEMISPGILPESIHEIVHGMDKGTENMVVESARGFVETFEADKAEALPEKSEAQPEASQRTGLGTSAWIGGPIVEAQAAEIKALQETHAEQLKQLNTALNIELKDRADKDAALADNPRLADLGPGGQKMLEDGAAANQQDIRNRYAVEEANLRQQQGIEMAGLQAKQVAQEPRVAPPPTPPPPPPPPTPTRDR